MKSLSASIQMKVTERNVSVLMLSCYTVLSNFRSKKATEQYFYVVIFIFYLDGLVI